jgi:hypothetical protein
MKNITLGTDTECAIRVLETKMIIPCTHVNTPETSEKRGILPNKAGTFHRDNVLLEFQTPPVSAAEFPHAVAAAYSGLQKLAASRGLQPMFQAYTHYPDPTMLRVVEALKNGCASDLCAYTGEEHFGPEQLSDTGRAAGGHIHIGGISHYSVEQKVRLVKILDWGLHAYELYNLSQQNREWATLRRTQYGQFGRWRDKDYGLEYRSPCPLWVRTALLRQQMTEMVLHAIRLSETLTDADLTNYAPTDLVLQGNVGKYSGKLYETWITADV